MIAALPRAASLCGETIRGAATPSLPNHSSARINACAATIPIRAYCKSTVDKAGDSKTVCYVKGNNDQLSTLINRPMIISGREYWIKRQTYPVLIPDRIVLK